MSPMQYQCYPGDMSVVLQLCEKTDLPFEKDIYRKTAIECIQYTQPSPWGNGLA